MSNLKRINSALISVFDKTNLEPIIEKLNKLGVRIYSTGGTKQFIEKLGVNVIAVEDLTMAIALNPQDVRSIYNLSTYYFQNKQFDLAEAQIAEALKIDPENLDIKYLFALILKEQGKVVQANKIMQELQAQQN